MSNIPNIRFKGFTDAWEQRKLEDVVEFLDTLRKPLEGAKRVPGPYPYYGASGIVDYVDGYLFDEELILLSEDGANITDRNYPICFLASGKYWVNNHAHVLKTKSGNENNFICNSLERKDYKQYNSGMAMPKLNQEVCRGIPVSCPSYDEQKKIGDYFRNLDNLITLHQKQCNDFKILKKYMLQKMLPKKGQKVPEIRFDGFTDDWEQRKLGEIGTAKSGIGFPDAEQGGAEGIPFFKVSDMNTEGNENELVVANNYVTEEQISRKKWNVIDDVPAIFFAKVGAAVMLNRKRLVRFPFLLDNNTMAYVFDKGIWDCDFGKTLFETIDLTKLTQVGALPSYNASDVEDVCISIPGRTEQEVIGKYFKQIDILITLHQL
jgi:type I restriction enzyme S subunit